MTVTEPNGVTSFKVSSTYSRALSPHARGFRSPAVSALVKCCSAFSLVASSTCFIWKSKAS